MGNLVFFLYLFVKTLKVKKCKILFSEKYLSMLNFWILAFFGCLINNESNIYLKFLFRKLFISLYHGQWTAGLAGYRCIPTRHGFLVSDKMSVKVNRRQWSHWKDSEKQFFHSIWCTYMITKTPMLTGAELFCASYSTALGYSIPEADFGSVSYMSESCFQH